MAGVGTLEPVDVALQEAAIETQETLVVRACALDTIQLADTHLRPSVVC
jgi:hypothetical protein